MQIAIDLPNDFVAFQGEQAIQQDMRCSYALWLYRAQRVTIARAAQLAGTDIYDFMQSCKENQIPVIDIDKATLLTEIEGYAAR